MKKNKMLIGIGLLIVAFLGISIYYMDFSNKQTKVEVKNNIYLFNKTKKDGVLDLSVYNHGGVLNLGDTSLGFVKYIQNEQKYLVAEPNEENDLQSNLVLINENGAKENLATVGTNMISKVDVMNDYIFYKESESSSYTAMNINEIKLDKRIVLKNSSKIISCVGEYAYYLDENNSLYSYNFVTNETKEIIKDCDTVNAFADNIVITLKNGNLYYYDMKTNKLTEDKYKVSDNINLGVASDSHDSCDTHGETEQVEINGGIPPIIIMKNYDGDKLIYEVPKPRQSGVKNLYLKVKNEKPVLLAENINQVKIFGNDCFVNTLITAANKKFTGEVKYINLNEPKDARVISNIYLNVENMEKAEDGTYYMNYSDIVEDTPEMFKYRGGLFKFNTSEKEVVNVANNVADFAVEGNNIIYAKVNSLTEWNGKYDVYINDKKVASNVGFAAIKGNVPVYEGEDGYLYLVKGGQPQKLDIKVQDYSSILNK
ncbi:MAG: hypothetical protein ACRCWM_11550 [Sarcina sp.]